MSVSRQRLAGSASGPARHPRPLAQVLRRRRRLRSGLVQLLAAAAAIALGILLPQAHVGLDIPTSQAIPMLVAVGAGTVTFIGVVFSLLFLVVQFGSTTFTPRLNLFRDAPIVWRAFAFYVGIVTYSFTAALVIGRQQTTPGLVPFVAFLAMLVAIVLYRSLQAAAFNSIQLSSTLSLITRRGREVIDGLYTAPAVVGSDASRPRIASRVVAGPAAREIRWPHQSTVIQVFDVPRLLEAAQRAGAMVELLAGPGQVIQEGAPVALVRGPAEVDLEPQVLRSITVGNERTFEQDPSLALRLLADIALRALSPAVNDPTTAVQALDRIESLLRALATRDLDVGDIVDATGTLRVRLVLPTWEDYLTVALDEIMALPELLPSISQRLDRLLGDVSAGAQPGLRPALDRRRARATSVPAASSLHGAVEPTPAGEGAQSEGMGDDHRTYQANSSLGRTAR